MKTEQPDLIAATKIVASTLLAGVGAVGLYGPYYPDSVHTRVAAAVLTLGLWLLVGAWTGRSITARLRSLYFWSSNLGVDSSKTKAESMGELNSDNQTRPA